jgi:hypothetical protein
MKQLSVRDTVALEILKSLVANPERYKYMAYLIESKTLTNEQATEKNLNKAFKMADQFMEFAENGSHS